MMSSNDLSTTSNIFFKLGCYIVSLTIISLIRNCVSLHESWEKQQNTNQSPSQSRQSNFNFNFTLVITFGISTALTIFISFILVSITSILYRTLSALGLTVLVELLTKIHLYVLIKYCPINDFFRVRDMVKARYVFFTIATGVIFISFLLWF